MLRKLIKYEWQSCARACLPIYAAAIGVALLNALISALGLHNMMHGIPTTLLLVVYGGVIIALFVITGVVLLQRFYKGLLGDEGYLMFTLPVTVSQHIICKAIVGMLMCLLSLITATISACILVGFFQWGQFFGACGQLFESFIQMISDQPATLLTCIETVLLVVLDLLGTLLFFYLCLAVGHLTNRHRFSFSVLAYFVLSTALTLVFWLTLEIGNALSIDFALTQWFHSFSPIAAANIGLTLMVPFCAARAAAFFFVTRFILLKRLNLE